MDPRKLDRAFKSFLRSHSIDLRAADTAAGVRAMLRFYAEARADGCEATDDEDMLLFQWGTYNWGAGERFELDVTRQVILPHDDDDHAIWQLHLTYRYPVSARLRALGSGDRWCACPSDLEQFEQFVGASPALAALAASSGAEVKVAFECAG